MEAVVGCNPGAVVEDVPLHCSVLKIFTGYSILAENVYILILCRVQFVEVEDTTCYVAIKVLYRLNV